MRRLKLKAPKKVLRTPQQRTQNKQYRVKHRAEIKTHNRQYYKKNRMEILRRAAQRRLRQAHGDHRLSRNKFK